MEYFKMVCPECNKNEIILRFKNDVGFCSKMCETNNRYRRRMRDPITGISPTHEEVVAYNGLTEPTSKDQEKN